MEKMVKRKACGAEIAKSAKVCPHCGAKHKKHTALGIILVVFGIFLIIGSLNSGDKDPQKVDDSTNQVSANAPEQESQQPENPTTFGVGDKVELNGIVVTLTRVYETSGREFFGPDEGNTFIICEFEIENNSDKDISISSLLCFEAYVDDYSTSMSLTATTSVDTEQLDGTIAAGKKMHGVIGYEAPADWSNIEIRFTPDFWAGKDIIFSHDK